MSVFWCLEHKEEAGSSIRYTRPDSFHPGIKLQQSLPRKNRKARGI